ncbi:MAG TPA: hypothetical protein VFQ61_16400 [Polyangiaceae bacterium]|nr:hypothetical protein [Polyangiaceae bacterium]
MRLNLLPELGALPIEYLDVDRIERFKAERLAAGVHRKTLNNLLVVVRAVLQLALERREIAAVLIVRGLPVAARLCIAPPRWLATAHDMARDSASARPRH